MEGSSLRARQKQKGEYSVVHIFEPYNNEYSPQLCAFIAQRCHSKDRWIMAMLQRPVVAATEMTMSVYGAICPSFYLGVGRHHSLDLLWGQ